MDIHVQLTTPCYADSKRELQPGDYTAQVVLNGIPFGPALHAKKQPTEERTMRLALEQVLYYFVRKTLESDCEQ